MEQKRQFKRGVKYLPFVTATSSAAGGGYVVWLSSSGSLAGKLLYAGGVALFLGFVCFILMKWMGQKAIDILAPTLDSDLQ